MKEERIYLSPPDLTGYESNEINDVLESNWIAPIGPHLAEFERLICEHTGFKYALALNSGTSAIHLALICHGIKANDYVISSTLTFCGAVNPILYQNAIPVLIDSSSKDWNLDPELVATAIKKTDPKPKAILATHLFGMPVDIKRLEIIGKQYDIPVIHDMAEAIGARMGNSRPGEQMETAILSFNGNKLITTSGGGAILTNNLDHYKRALKLSTQAKAGNKTYSHNELGFNYRLSNVLAGLGIAQFKQIQNKINSKRNIFDHYKSSLSGIPGVKFQEQGIDSFSDRWLTAIYFNPDNFDHNPVGKIIEVLDANNIESRYIWKPMHLQPLYQGYSYYGSNISEKLFENGVCLPSGTSLRRPDQDRIIELIISTLKAYQ